MSGRQRGTAGPPGSARPRGGGVRQLPGFAEKVLDVVEQIPVGRVMSYGDIAEFLQEGGPRHVGRVMAEWGGAVAWWRVVHSDGSFLAGHTREAIAHYQKEGTPLRRAQDGSAAAVDMRRARWGQARGTGST